jgi:hypothetical protein
MTDYIDYNTTANITSITGALRYSSQIFQSATGFDMFFGFLLICFYVGAFILSSRYGFERALGFASIFGFLVAFLMVWAGLLNPIWLLITIIFTAASLILGW